MRRILISLTVLALALSVFAQDRTRMGTTDGTQPVMTDSATMISRLRLDLDRTQSILGEIRNKISTLPTQDPRIAEALASASTGLQSANSAFTSGAYDRSRMLLIDVNRKIEAIRSLFSAPDSGMLKSRLDRIRIELENLTARIGAATDIGALAHDLLSQARSDFANAQAAYQAGNYARCASILDMVSAKMQKLQTLLVTPTAARPSASAMEELAGLVQRTLRILETQDRAEAGDVKSKIEALLMRARTAWTQGNQDDFREAAAEIRTIAGQIQALVGDRNIAQLRGKAEEAIKRASEKVESVRDSVGKSEAVREAAGLVKQARRAFKDEHYRKAILQATSAVRLLDRNGTGSTRDEAKAARRVVSSAERLIAQARALPQGQCAESEKLICRAEQHLDKARKAMESGRDQAATEQAQISTRFALRCIEVCTKTSGGTMDRSVSRLTEELGRLNRLIERVEARAANQPLDARSAGMLRNAMDHAQTAARALDSNEPAKAEREIVIARTFAYKVLSANQGQNDRVEDNTVAPATRE